MLSQDGEYPQYSDERHSIEQAEPQFQRDTRPLRLSPEKSYDKSKRNRSAEPSEMLWIGFPSFLEIEKITTFPCSSYAFVRLHLSNLIIIS